MDGRKKIDPTLLELCLGILLFGILCQITVVWFLKDKLGYSLGLWIGTLLALGSAVHMWWSINRYLDRGAGAPKLAAGDNLLRYGVILTVMAAVLTTKTAQPLAVFLGLMGLKAAAYIRPITHKLLHINEVRR